MGEFRTRLEAAVDEANPERAVIDSLSELRMLSGDLGRYRRQVASLKQYFLKRGCTLFVTDDNTSEQSTAPLHSLVHGVIALTRGTRSFGGARRTLEVVKVRARDFSDGLHDYAIQTGGLIVYPRQIAAAHRATPPAELVGSGLPAFDALLGGGVHRGTSVALIGPSGIGKSTTALQYVRHDVSRGAKASIFLFDESLRTLQLNAVGADLSADMAAGRVTVEQLDPAELSPGEFTARVRRAVESGVEIIVIDGLNGYLNAMPDEHLLMLQLHELVAYLSASNVTTFLLVSLPGALALDAEGGLEVGYLADTVVLYRNYELQGEVRRALSVLKHRGASHPRACSPTSGRRCTTSAT